ncbi:hypothetical protein [Wolbachia endosymbiont (group A) of Agelastica alni]
MSVTARFFRLLCNKAIPVSEHWDDTVCCANYLLIAMVSVQAMAST